MKWTQKKFNIINNQYHGDFLNFLANASNITDVKRFLQPSEDELFSPYLLLNIKIVRDRIIKAIDKSERISIFADPDVDGVCSTVILYKYLLNFVDENKITYFHSQRDRGHGLNVLSGIEDIPYQTTLVIAVDSSTNDVEFSKMLLDNNIDVVIIDHHKQERENPYALIVNPQLRDDPYPNKSVCGSQVVFKVIQTLDIHFSTSYSEDFYDLISLATTGDVMDLSILENRFMVDCGLKNIHNEGLKALLDCFKKDIGKIKTSDFSYSLVPALNACCRLNQMELAIELLTSIDYSSASSIASRVVELNEVRKKTQLNYYNKLLPEVQKSIKRGNKCTIIVDQDIGKGYRGLCCADFANEFQQTIFIVSDDKEKGYYSGSFRTYNDFNVREFLSNVPDLIEIVGHDTVGGTRFLKKNLHNVVEYFNRNIQEDNKEKEVFYVCSLDVDEITSNLVESTEELYKISGQGFETGRFLIKNLRPQKKEILGKDRNTIKIPCISMSKSYFYSDKEIEKMAPAITLMKFRTNEDYFDDALIGEEIQAVGTLNINEWTNPRTKKTTKTIQVFIDDYRVIS